MWLKATVSSFLFVFLFSTLSFNAIVVIVKALMQAVVPDVLCEHGGEGIDQSGSEAHRAHILLVNCVHASVPGDSVCPQNTAFTSRFVALGNTCTFLIPPTQQCFGINGLIIMVLQIMNPRLSESNRGHPADSPGTEVTTQHCSAQPSLLQTCVKSACRCILNIKYVFSSWQLSI